MIRLLEDNPIGVALASLAGGLLVISLLLAVIWSLPPAAPPVQGVDTDTGPGLDIPELADAEPLEAFAVITERPVFNESRQPVLMGDGSEEDEEDLVEEEVEAPEVHLAGVVITPSIRMVMLRREDDPVSLVAFEGQPLEGDYGSWRVSRIDEREVTLTSGAGEELQLQLEVHKSKIAPPPKLAKEEDAPAAPGRDDPEADSDVPMTRAEEIRQRIAERREELRRAAEEKELNADSEVEEADYRTAIQSMMNGRKKEQRPDEDQR
jgi:hypothetical protein